MAKEIAWQTHLAPLVRLWIIAFHLVKVLLTIVTAHCIQLIPEQAGAHSVSGRADGRHQSPRVCFGVIPTEKNRSLH